MEHVRAKDALKDTLASAQDMARARYQHALSATRHYVDDNPWKAIGIAAAIGALIGLLMTRR